MKNVSKLPIFSQIRRSISSTAAKCKELNALNAQAATEEIGKLIYNPLLTSFVASPTPTLKIRGIQEQLKSVVSIKRNFLPLLNLNTMRSCSASHSTLYQLVVRNADRCRILQFIPQMLPSIILIFAEKPKLEVSTFYLNLLSNPALTYHRQIFSSSSYFFSCPVHGSCSILHVHTFC